MDASKLITNVISTGKNVSEANKLQKKELAERWGDRLGNKQKESNSDRLEKITHENGKEVKLNSLATQAIESKRMEKATESTDFMKCRDERGFSKQMATDLQVVAVYGLRKGDITDSSKKINEMSKLHNWKKVCSKLTGKAR